MNLQKADNRIGSRQNMELEELAEPDWLCDADIPLETPEDPHWVDAYEF
jgi:hypothetical protein